MQEIIVTIIVAVAVLAAIRHFYRRLTGRSSACDSCPEKGSGNCSCNKR